MNMKQIHTKHLSAAGMALLLLSVLFFGCDKTPPTTASNDPAIRNFLRVNPEFCTGGQPQLEQLAKLKAQGITTIINLRLPSEHDADAEESKAQELGLKYYNIPVIPDQPQDEQVVQFLRITDDPANRPAFIHCTAAVRVGAFWMIRRVLRDGWKMADAEAEAERIGLRGYPVLTEFAHNYIERHRQG